MWICICHKIIDFHSNKILGSQFTVNDHCIIDKNGKFKCFEIKLTNFTFPKEIDNKTVNKTEECINIKIGPFDFVFTKYGKLIFSDTSAIY